MVFKNLRTKSKTTYKNDVSVSHKNEDSNETEGTTNNVETHKYTLKKKEKNHTLVTLIPNII